MKNKTPSLKALRAGVVVDGRLIRTHKPELPKTLRWTDTGTSLAATARALGLSRAQFQHRARTHGLTWTIYKRAPQIDTHLVEPLSPAAGRFDYAQCAGMANSREVLSGILGLPWKAPDGITWPRVTIVYRAGKGPLRRYALRFF